MPWLLALAVPLLGWGLWCLYRKPGAEQRKEIHLLRGTPKRWGLFGESCGEQLSNVSVGTRISCIRPTGSPISTRISVIRPISRFTKTVRWYARALPLPQR
ncbi:intracellular growth attenuator family protein [Edwardsiella anguillarum]|nr:intracellular growth attenuator family protein [Edwardsiella anguillarum]